jgi:hypothetical protein
MSSDDISPITDNSPDWMDPEIDKIEVLTRNRFPALGPRCESLCVSDIWHHKVHKKFPQCKWPSSYKYKGKTYCSRHLGYILIEEKLNEQRR